MKLVLPLRTGLAVLVLSGVATAAPERWLLAETAAAAAPYDWRVLAEDGSGVELELRVNWLELRHGLDGTRLELPGGGSAGLPGDPALPALSRLVALPGDADATMSILELETVTRRDWTPARQEAWTSDRPDSPAAPGIPPVPANGPWPAQWVRLEESAVWHGVRVAGLDVSVVRWDEEPGELQALRRLRLRLDWQRGALDPPRLRAGGAEARKLVAGSLLNPQGAWQAGAERVADPARPGSYLVVVPDAAMGGLEEWIRWKRESGHEVAIILESELGGSSPSFSLLRQAVQEAFDAEPFEYLMLVGDIDRYPSGTETSFNLEAGFIDGGGYSESQWGARCNSGACIVSDHLFSLLEGDDYFADVLVGRLSVDNANDVVRSVRRMVDYEAAPFIGLGQDWFRRGLMIYDVAYAASRRETKLAIRDMLLADAGFTQVDTIRNHYQQSPVSPALVTQRINAGVSVVNYRGYGFRNQWFGPNFGVDQMGGLTNVGRWPFVTSIVCGGGDFASVDNDPCLGEAFLRAGSPMEPTGAIGFMGPSEEDTHTEWNNCIDEGIYHGLTREGLRSLGALMDRGKLELWSSYPNARNWGATGYNVPFYFHAYNLLGDPGLEIRVAAPRELVCAVPDQLPIGLDWLELRATAGDGGEVDELRGTLYHAATDQAVVARADADGLVRFPLGGMAAGEWILTLGGPDWMPLRGTIQVDGAASGLRLTHWSLTGSQPADSVAHPGGERMLHLRLEELGAGGAAAGRVLRLELPEACGSVLVDSLLLEAGEPGQEHELQGLAFRLARLLPYGEPVPLRLTLDGALLALLELPVVQPGFRVEGAGGVEGDLEPGFQGHLAVNVRGLGLPVGEALVARLGALHDQVQLATRDSSPFLLEPDSLATLAEFRLIIDDELLAGSQLPFELGIWRASAPPDAGPVLALLGFQVALGGVAAVDPLGPDLGGYLAWHSGDVGDQAPEHAWESIAGTGTELDMLDWYDPWGEGLDGVSVAVDLPFSFRFYGRDYQRATVCSNGWLAFGDQEDWYTALNTPIPAAQGPSAMIAAYWTDLINSYGAGRFGHAYVESRPDVGLFIVEWNHFQSINSSSNVDVQLVLRDPSVWPTATGDGEILLHLHDISTSNGANGVTIGLENPSETAGLQVVCNNSYAPAQQPIVDGCSILFTPMESHTVVEEPATRPGARLEVGPNPFNPSTRLRVELPGSARWRWTLHNVAGQSVARSGWLSADGGRAQAELDGSRLSSGLYLVRVEWEGLAAEAARGVLGEKILLVK
jgi:hypothetical protein